jgi:hypothetical protein
MALLNPPDVLPEAMRYLVRTLLALSQPHTERDELIALVAPRGLTEAMDSLATAADMTDAEPDDLKTGGSVIATASLDALRSSLGVVEQQGSRVKLSTAYTNLWKKPVDLTAETMREFLLDAVLQRANPEVPYGDPIGSTDLAQATVLLHTAPQPLQPFDRFEPATTGRSFANWQLEIFGPERVKSWPVPNKEQWQSFRRWVTYLGLGRPVGTTGLIPDASEALIQRLRAVQPGDYDIGDFVGRCARAVPVLDGALWRAPLAPDDGDARVLSGGLSVSLLQLEADGFVTMVKPKSDTVRDSRILRLRPDRSVDRPVGSVSWRATTARRGGR